MHTTRGIAHQLGGAVGNLEKLRTLLDKLSFARFICQKADDPCANESLVTGCCAMNVGLRYVTSARSKFYAKNTFLRFCPHSTQHDCNNNIKMFDSFMSNYTDMLVIGWDTKSVAPKF